MAAALVAAVTACAPHRPPPPPPLAAVALLPIVDGPERSAVTGVFTFYSWIAETRAAVPGALAAAIRAALATRGIATVAADAAGAPATIRQASEAVAAAHLETPALFVVIDKWEAENVDTPQFVHVGLDATLFAPTGKILWTTRREAGPVSTLNATDLAGAYQKATESVAEWLVGDWTAQAGGATVEEQ